MMVRPEASFHGPIGSHRGQSAFTSLEYSGTISKSECDLINSKIRSRATTKLGGIGRAPVILPGNFYLLLVDETCEPLKISGVFSGDPMALIKAHQKRCNSRG
jgi:hypothetical protein